MKLPKFELNITPMTRRRLRAFRNNRRAWWSLMAFCVLAVFAMCAELVCPCDPKAITKPETLEAYRRVRIEEKLDVRAARFNLTDDGKVESYEGPADVLAAVTGGWKPGDPIEGFDVVSKKRAGYTRVFLRPLEPPKVISREEVRDPVSWPFPPVKGHPFGIDSAGRDVYARVVHALRISLLFGLVLAFWAMLGGLVVGALEGYFGGWTDILGQRFTEIWSALPFLYVMIFIGSTVGHRSQLFDMLLLLLCYSLFNWIVVSYYVRAEFLRLRSRPFVEAAKCQGFSAVRIIFREILPNALTPLVTLFPFLLMGAIGSLAALDFLGFGLPPMTPSLGELLNQASQFRGAWWLILFPTLALFTVMLLTVLVGEGLRDAFDPRRASKIE